MRFDDLVRVSLRQVVRHRRRYLGVVLAIAVGVAGFISIITMGQDVKKNFNKDLAFIGGVTIIGNVLEFRPQYPLSFNNFHADTIRAIQEIPGVAVASLVGFSRINGFWKGQPEMFPVVAVDQNFWEMRNLKAHTGALFGRRVVEERQRLVVLGKRLAQRLYGTNDVAGRSLELDHDIYRVIGVVAGLRDINMEKSIFVPLTTARDRLTRELGTDRLYVRCATWDDAPWRPPSPKSYKPTNRQRTCSWKSPGKTWHMSSKWLFGLNSLSIWPSPPPLPWAVWASGTS